MILYKKANFNRIAADDGFLLPAGEISSNTLTILKLLGIYKNLSLCIQLNSIGLSKRLLFFRIADMILGCTLFNNTVFEHAQVPFFLQFLFN